MGRVAETRRAARHGTGELIAALHEHYAIGHAAKLGCFLESSPHLLDVLLAAPARIGAYYPHRPLSLEVITDPEAEQRDHADHLVLYIATDLAVPEAMTQMQRLEEEWGLDALQLGRGALSIDLRFV